MTLISPPSAASGGFAWALQLVRVERAVIKSPSTINLWFGCDSNVGYDFFHSAQNSIWFYDNSLLAKSINLNAF